MHQGTQFPCTPRFRAPSQGPAILGGANRRPCRRQTAVIDAYIPNRLGEIASGATPAAGGPRRGSETSTCRIRPFWGSGAVLVYKCGPLGRRIGVSERILGRSSAHLGPFRRSSWGVSARKRAVPSAIRCCFGAREGCYTRRNLTEFRNLHGPVRIEPPPHRGPEGVHPDCPVMPAEPSRSHTPNSRGPPASITKCDRNAHLRPNGPGYRPETCRQDRRDQAAAPAHGGQKGKFSRSCFSFPSHHTRRSPQDQDTPRRNKDQPRKTSPMFGIRILWAIEQEPRPRASTRRDHALHVTGLSPLGQFATTPDLGLKGGVSIFLSSRFRACGGWGCMWFGF